MKGYTLKVSALAAALKCAADSDPSRPYLMAVHLDFRAGCIVGTDGHRLFCGEIPRADCDPVTVPRATVEAVLKANRTLRKAERLAAALFVNVEPGDGERAPRNVTLNHVAAGFSVTAAEFPDQWVQYQRVIPRKPDGVPAAYNAQYVADMAEALATYAENDNRDRVHFMQWHFNGESGGLFVRSGFPALGVIMPIRACANGEDTADALAWMDKPTMKPAALGLTDAEIAEANGEPAPIAHCGAEFAAAFDPSGALQAAGCLVVDAPEGEHIVLETLPEDADPLS